MTTDHYCVLQ